MNEGQTISVEPVEEMPQCLEGAVKQCLEGAVESKEREEQRRRIEILKHWEIGIQVLDRGCVVKVGCKSVAFTSIEVGYKEIGRYLENPQLVAIQYEFEKYL